jgi:hypothetical protein
MGKKRMKAAGARTACAMMTIFRSLGTPPPPLDPLDDVSEELPDEDEDEAEPEDVEATVVKGLELLPPTAFWRLRVVESYSVCCETEALTLSEDTAEPLL